MGFIICKCFCNHHRPQVRTSDADVHNVGKSLSVAAANASVNHPLAKAFDLIDDGMNAWNNIFIIYSNILIARGTQGSVQYCSPFCGVDDRPTKVVIHRFFELAFFCECSQQIEGLLRQVIFGKIDIKIFPTNAKLLSPFGVICKKVLQRYSLSFFTVFL